MTETRLNNNAQHFQNATLPGYSPDFKHRNNRRGDGIGACIHYSQEYKRRKNIESLEPDLGHQWI